MRFIEHTKRSISSIASKIMKAVKHYIVYTTGCVVQSASALVLIPVLTTNLSARDFGVFSLIAILSTVSSAVFYLGVTSALPKSYYNYDLIEKKNKVFSTGFTLISLGAIAQAVLGSLFSEELSFLLLGNKNYDLIICWAMVGGGLGFINQYIFTYLRLMERVWFFFLLNTLLGVGVILVTYLLLQRDSGNPIIPFLAIAFTNIVVLVVAICLVSKDISVLDTNYIDAKNLLVFGLPIVIASFGQMILDWSDRILIERYMSIADVGLYSAVYRIGMVVNILVVIPFTQVWQPLMYKNRSNVDIDSIFNIALKSYIFIGIAVVICIATVGQEVLHFLVRANYNAELMYAILILSSAGAFIFGLSNIVVAGILFEGRTKILVRIYYFAAFIKILIGITLIGWFGLIGISAANLLASFFVPCAIYFYSKKFFSPAVDYVRLFLAVMLLSIFCVFAMTTSLNMEWALVINGTCGFFTIVTVCFVLIKEMEIKLLKNYLKKLI